MAVNSSSFNDSLPYPNNNLDMYCFSTTPGFLVNTICCITNIVFILPLCIFILYLGLQRWRQQRSTSAATTTSHSDSFTYHMVAMDLICVLGYALCCWGIYKINVNIFDVGYLLSAITWYGATFFHVLTCMEPYLVVVHPITYLSLKRERGIRIRNICIGCVWLLCFGAAMLISFKVVSIIVDFCLLISSLIVISFCSLSVLRVLIRAGPGEQGGDRERVDQSKRRAFYTITAILGVLVLRFSMNMVLVVLTLLEETTECVMTVAEVWFNIPSSLVLPLLFLHRAGSLTCCKNNTK